MVEELRDAANGKYANLKIVEIPTALTKHYYVHEYDGQESVEYMWDRWLVDNLDSLTAEPWKENLKALVKLSYE